MYDRFIIKKSDTAEETARKMWNNFNIYQSVTILGAKGEHVLDLLMYYDDMENFTVSKRGKRTRIERYHPNSVGGPIAHKIFKYGKRKIDGIEAWTIWRVQ